MNSDMNPWHAHIYFDPPTRPAAARAHRELAQMLEQGTCAGLVFVGRMVDEGVGPHPKPQFEIHFHEHAVPRITGILAASGLASLIHPLTDDDLADHTTLARWLGEPIPLDVSVLDPPGHNQGFARFGKTDF